MIGYVNGSYLNRAILNGGGGEGFLFAQVLATQADASSESAGVVFIASDALLGQASTDLLAAAANAISAESGLAQDDLQATLAALAIVGADLLRTQDPETVFAVFKPRLIRNMEPGRHLSAHANGVGLSRHSGGNSLMVH